MPVKHHNNTIELSGRCPVQDADPLLALLLEHPATPVDLRNCTHVHAAVVQVLRCSGAAVSGLPAAAPLRALLAAVLLPTPDASTEAC